MRINGTANSCVKIKRPKASTAIGGVSVVISHLLSNAHQAAQLCRRRCQPDALKEIEQLGHGHRRSRQCGLLIAHGVNYLARQQTYI
jgi:hypothetical protein